MNVVSIVLIVFFMLASSIKTLGWQKKVFETQLAFFKNYGLNRQIMFVVGCLELTGAMSLLLGLVGWVPELSYVFRGIVIGCSVNRRDFLSFTL